MNPYRSPDFSDGWSHEDAMLERMADRDGEGCEPFFGQRS